MRHTHKKYPEYSVTFFAWGQLTCMPADVSSVMFFLIKPSSCHIYKLVMVLHN